MTGTVITDLRRRGAVDPSRVLTGPLRAVGLQWLDPGRSVEVAAEGVERALYITAGSGIATVPGAEADASTVADSGLPLVEGTALTLPLGARTVLTAGTTGLEYFHAILAVTGRPGGATAHPAAERPTTEQHVTEQPATERPVTERPSTEQPVTEHPATDDGSAADTPDRPETPPSPKGGEAR
ncbi:hypothetical protein [Streptomyces sp. NRRL S-495]|uniref:hypothetical protein n=1 Tax=Streptomyces sp. NRRL S-495 TaxID=1609133 RepID=UPI0005F8DCC8|nr:hypothetical protein [Streptomyces sp. NRRL S-495]KJY32701.1 hypothetical protein VR45_21865 [Streptomyces sp. NRRL S-495]